MPVATLQVVKNPSREQILAFQKNVYFPYTLEVAGIDLEDEMKQHPKHFPGGVDSMITSFIEHTGRLPLNGKEIDYFAGDGSDEEYAAFLKANNCPFPAFLAERLPNEGDDQDKSRQASGKSKIPLVS